MYLTGKIIPYNVSVIENIIYSSFDYDVNN